MAKKLISLRTLENQRKHFSTLGKTAKKATKMAFEESKALKLPIVYMQGDKIVEESADGSITIIGEIEKSKNGAKFKKGQIIYLDELKTH